MIALSKSLKHDYIEQSLDLRRAIWFNGRYVKTTTTKRGAAKALKISAKARYGLRIMMDVAAHEHDPSPRTMAAIAKDQDLSLKFASRLVIPLRKAGMIRSIRGVAGGFRLTKDPDEITLLAIVETMQGPLAILDGLDDTCANEKTSAFARAIWGDVNNALRNALAGITLTRMMKMARTAETPTFDYCI